MTAELSPNTQAIVLLTSPLLVGRGISPLRPLGAAEYGSLALYLHERNLEPADLLSADADPIIDGCQVLSDKDRVRRLLERGFLLSQAVESWRSRAIWVISRADTSYPRRIKARMGLTAPPVLYGCGNPDLLNAGGLAVVGSRNIDDELVRYTAGIGRVAAHTGTTLVSGGARGVDATAMASAIEAGGTTVGVLADALERAALSRVYRGGLLSKKLALITPFDPTSRFTVGNAMRRNKIIYGLADAALVVSADWKKGGTWAGAYEQLDRLRFVKVYVRSTGEPQKGLNALVESGAEEWPNPRDADSMRAALSATVTVKQQATQASFHLTGQNADADRSRQAIMAREDASPPSRRGS